MATYGLEIWSLSAIWNLTGSGFSRKNDAKFRTFSLLVIIREGVCEMSESGFKFSWGRKPLIYTFAAWTHSGQAWRFNSLAASI